MAIDSWFMVVLLGSRSRRRQEFSKDIKCIAGFSVIAKQATARFMSPDGVLVTLGFAPWLDDA